MRNAFFDELLELYRNDSRVVFVTGDLGYKLFDALKQADPDRVINFGIRENAMVGFAAGLARKGMMPFVYSIVPFVTLRCLEQIKLDLCYNRARVVIVGVGGGFAYGPNGPTHHGPDDVGALSILPGLTIWTPADGPEVRMCVRASVGLDGPAYLRLGRTGEPALDAVAESDGLCRPRVLQRGTDGTIISMGAIVHEVLAALSDIEASALRPTVLHLPTYKPFPEKELLDMLVPGRPVLTVEEHVAAGGLGRATGSLLAHHGIGAPFDSLHAPDAFPDVCLSREAALVWGTLDRKSIAKRFVRLVNRAETRKESP